MPQVKALKGYVVSDGGDAREGSLVGEIPM